MTNRPSVAAIFALAGLAASLASAQPPAQTTPKPIAPAAPGPPSKPAAPDPQEGVSKDRILDSIRALPTKRSSWGDDDHRKGLRDTEKLLSDKLAALGYQPKLDPVDFLGHRVQDHEEGADKPFNNLIVDLPGTTAKDQVLILSAHMDAVPGAPGADDDGSGVAVVLEAARLLKDRPTQRSIRFILFNLEESGLVGSRAYTQRLKPELDAGKEKVVGMISVDGVGYFSDEPDSQKSPLPPMGSFKPPTVGDFLGMAGILRFRPFSQALDKSMKAAEPRLKTVVVDFLPFAPPDLLRSDHAPFLLIGVPAVILADTANFRNPHYHKPTDTIDTLDPERLTIVARGVVGGLHRLAGPPGTELIDIAPLIPPPPREEDKKPEAPSAPPAKSP